MELVAIEMRNATLKANAKIVGGQLVTTLALRAPLTPEIAESLGCRESVYTETGDLRPHLFRSSVFDIGDRPVSLRLRLDGIAKREIAADKVEAGPVTIEHQDRAVALLIKLVMRGAGRPQLALLSFAMEVGNAPLVCSLQPIREEQQELGGESRNVCQEAGA